MSLKVQVTITRDSVCMADDKEDHTKFIKVIFNRNTQDTIMSIAQKYLPNIMGDGHTWDCFLDGSRVATINGNCKKITSAPNCHAFRNGGKLYFKYNSSTY